MRVSNTKLYTIEPHQKKPEVPKYYYEAQDRWIDNPSDPQYISELQIYTLFCGEAALDYIISVQAETPEGQHHKLTEEENLIVDSLASGEISREIAYKKYVLFADNLSKVVDEACLTEQRIMRFFRVLENSAERKGDSLLLFPLKFSIDIATHIKPLVIAEQQIVHPTDELLCCSDSNIDWMLWLRNEFTLDEMAQTIAIWRLNKIIESHRSDEQAIYQERESKKKH